MKTIRDRNITPLYRNACIAMIWLIVFYSSIIQYKVIEIPNGMLILGIIILLLYYLDKSRQPYVLYDQLTEESIYMVLYMLYMFTIGTFVSINRQEHLAQAITSMQFLFILLVTSSLIKSTGTGAFHNLLLVKSIVLAIVFILNPVVYEGDRYTISTQINPNGLGMAFAAGIWSALYRYQKKKNALILTVVLITLFGYCIVQTGSRKSLIATGIIVLLWILFCFIPSTKKDGGVKGVVTLLTMGVLIVVIWRLFNEVYSESTLSNRMERLLYETTEGNRSQMYRSGLEMLKSYPIFGLGFQGFKQLYGLYSHATIIEIPVSGGIVGALLYFYVYFISIKRVICIYRRTKGIQDYELEHEKTKMVLVLWAAMLFYTTCIIHQYLFDSFVVFGIIFGESSYIEQKINQETGEIEKKDVRSKYIKYGETKI